MLTGPAALTGCAPPATGTGAHPGAYAGAKPPRAGDLPPVVDHVRTRDRVVFLTYDDGAERDPALVGLVRARRLPVTLFLTDTVVGPAYGRLARLRSVGASLQNHTLDHAALRGLPYAGQRAEICGQQRKLTSRFGVRPRLFRPPHGTYDTTTLRAAADCGITAVVLWRVSVDPAGTLAYARGEPRLHPGDIITLADPPLAPRTKALLTRLTRQGFRVASLDDYL
ncbi:polysaccharide deacetylase family protein [Streptomyces sp. NPDC005876]|uniref:polysaccharide deacetylase family protein n=1 Tax=Streptomyces sp. NPDC005876 TaxID=3157076 RepID=UPI0033DDF1BC